MPRGAADTRRRIYDAAVTEFAEHGLHGTTIDRIARRADVNRERVYSYFGDKAALFAHVVSTELAGIANAVPLVVNGPADVGAFAGDTYDYQQTHPHLARLVIWEGLADAGDTPQQADRKQMYAAKTAAVAAAQQSGAISSTIEPAALVFLVISLSSYWLAAPQLARMLLAGTEPGPQQRRAAVVAAAIQLVTP